MSFYSASLASRPIEIIVWAAEEGLEKIDQR